MTSYPLTFKATAKMESGSDNWTSEPAKGARELPLRNVLVSVPPEFGGPGTGFSPEDLCAMMLANCYVATFKVFAALSKLTYQDITVEVALIIDKEEETRQPVVKETKFRVEIMKPSDKARAERIMQKVSTNCIMINSMKMEKTFEFLAFDGLLT